MNTQNYTEDFHAWALQNAQLLREGRLEDIDIDNIAEELEDIPVIAHSHWRKLWTMPIGLIN